MNLQKKLFLSFSLPFIVIGIAQAAEHGKAASTNSPSKSPPVYAGSAEENAVAKAYRFTPNPKLPNVLLLGDSISIGYTLPVRHDLDGIANVYRPMQADGRTENCGGSQWWVKGNLDRWLKLQPKWGVIHFNVGLHDLKRIDPVKGPKFGDPNVPPATSLENYKKDLEQIVIKLKATGAHLIFATTTPTVLNCRPIMLPNDVVSYNAAAVEIMKKHDIAIDDLYSAMLPKQSELQTPNNCHFKNEGNLFLGNLVAESIKNAIADKSK